VYYGRTKKKIKSKGGRKGESTGKKLGKKGTKEGKIIHNRTLKHAIVFDLIAAPQERGSKRKNGMQGGGGLNWCRRGSGHSVMHVGWADEWGGGTSTKREREGSQGKGDHPRPMP